MYRQLVFGTPCTSKMLIAKLLSIWVYTLVHPIQVQCQERRPQVYVQVLKHPVPAEFPAAQPNIASLGSVYNSYINLHNTLPSIDNSHRQKPQSFVLLFGIRKERDHAVIIS